MALYRIGTAARLSGLAVATLRNWEQRYGLVRATRTPGGQRLYTREDVERLRRLKQWTDSGLSAGEAHNLLRQRRPEADTPPGAAVARWRVREDARRLRADVAATHARAADERARALAALTALAGRVHGEHRARLLQLAARARARESRLRPNED